MTPRTQYQDFLADMPRFRSMGRISRRSHVKHQLNTTRAMMDPGYALAVLHHYAQSKMERGKSKMQVHAKLEALEMKMPHFGNDFRMLRQQLELIPSRVLPNGELGPPPPPYPNKPHCSCTCSCGAQEEDTVGLHANVSMSALPARDTYSSISNLAEPGEGFPSRPSAVSFPSTSSSVSSMSMLTNASISTDALSMAPTQSRRRPLSMLLPRMRLASASNVSLA